MFPQYTHSKGCTVLRCRGSVTRIALSSRLTEGSLTSSFVFLIWLSERLARLSCDSKSAMRLKLALSYNTAGKGKGEDRGEKRGGRREVG